MAARFILADENGARIISELRHEIWDTTYRGIYSDERIDGYDYEEHRQRDLKRIRDSSYHIYLIFDGDDPIGYLGFMSTETVYIQSLYIKREYQRRGIGKQAFELIREFCSAHGFDKFTCNCNSHNYPAQDFYRSMGGTVIKRNEGHDDKYDDQITFEFCV
ncbi:MAG: GNAT family N-acetyltransferase [Oscillospiraceae bacterium]|nr:GNAT family N-acetyltransferase [Oscillospiraceae bacterium]